MTLPEKQPQDFNWVDWLYNHFHASPAFSFESRRTPFTPGTPEYTSWVFGNPSNYKGERVTNEPPQGRTVTGKIPSSTIPRTPFVPTTDMTEEEKEQLDFINQTRVALGLPTYNSLAEYKADIIALTDPFEEQRAKVKAARAEGYDLSYNKTANKTFNEVTGKYEDTGRYQYTPSPSESAWGQNISDIYNRGYGNSQALKLTDERLAAQAQRYLELGATPTPEMDAAMERVQGGIDRFRRSSTGDISNTGNPELDALINDVIQSGNPQMEAEVRRNYADTIYNRRQQQASAQQQQQMALYSGQPSTWLQYAQAAQNPVKVQDWMKGLLPQSYQTTQQASPFWAGQTTMTETQNTAGWKSGTVLPNFGGRKAAMWGIGNEMVTGEEYNQRFGLEGTNKVAEWEDATYDWSNLPKLLTPSAQYLARMTPEQQAQYYGYEQASKKLRPEDLQYKLWGNIPTGANRGLTYRT